MQRRQFITASVAWPAAGLCSTPRTSVPAPCPAATQQTLMAGGTAFGTTITLSAPVAADASASERRHVTESLRQAVRETQRIDAIMSLYRSDSELSRLNRTGILRDPDPHLLANLCFALRLADLTGGAFDPTVQPLWDVFSAAAGRGKLPGAAAIASARSKVDHRRVRVEADAILLGIPGMALTLNAVAQGYACDVVRAMLKRDGIPAALIDTGEFGSIGRASDGAAWRLGIQSPRLPDQMDAIVRLDGRVVATSGDYATAFSPDFRYHHIFDPATGVSPPGWSSTVVLAPSGLVADGLSTALMVVDESRGKALLREFAQTDAIWIDKAQRLTHSSGIALTDQRHA